MRRALAVAALVLPAALAVAQVPPAAVGQVLEQSNFDVTTGDSFINAAHCAGTDTLDLEWNTLLTSGSFTEDGTYRIFASDSDPSARAGEDANFCHEDDDPNATPPVFAGPVATFPDEGIVQDAEVVGSTVAAEAGFTCGPAGEGQVVYICAHWFETATARRGRASGRFIVQVKAPDSPVIRDVLSGNGRLEVSWDPGPGGEVDAESYVALASTVAGGRAVASATTDAESVTIGGLANFTTYSVTVRAASIGGNLSDPSFAVSGTPAPSGGFLDVYGGVETGGCSTGTAGAVALLGTASLLLIRRRKP
jgi:uncharacterized protein (TIGR03382 family)